MTNYLNTGLMFTDIHWGKKQNADSHNINCLNFIKHICKYLKKNKQIDHIVFLGDWFENRNAVNIATMNFAYDGAKLLNDLNIPVFFIVGNHDLYTRVHRDIHSVIMYQEFTNFQLIGEPTVIPNLGPDGALVCPYLFHHEYDNLEQYKDIPVFFGHFEFQGFVVTGYSTIMHEGPSHKNLKNQKRVFSGHFHKRQISDNVCYIGKTFPMEYGDSNDFKRGFAVYTHDTDKLKFIDWADGPKYIKVYLSDLLDNKAELFEHSYVKCVADIDINYEEYTKIRKMYIQKFTLREFIIEELPTTVLVDEDGMEVSTDDASGDIDLHDHIGDTDEIIINCLRSVDHSKVDTNKLITIYKGLGE